MKVLRLFAGIIAGYLVYAIASMFLVGLIMEKTGVGIVILGLVGLTLIGLVAGCLAGKIAGSSSRVAGSILAGLVVAATLANLLMQLGAEPTWYKVGTLLLTAPAIAATCMRPSGQGSQT